MRASAFVAAQELYVGVWRYTATSHVNIDATTGQSTEVIAMGACGDPIVDDSKLATLQARCL